MVPSIACPTDEESLLFREEDFLAENGPGYQPAEALESATQRSLRDTEGNRAEGQLRAPRGRRGARQGARDARDVQQ